MMKKALLSLVVIIVAASAHARETGSAISALQFSDIVIQFIQKADFKSLAGQVCSRNGLNFSPYARNYESLVVTKLPKKVLVDFNKTKNKYVWGKYDGSGSDIYLTPKEYYAKFIYDVDYKSKGAISYLSSSQLNNNSELAGLVKAYPLANVVSYKYEGTKDIEYKDAKELLIIIRKTKNSWCLDGIAHNEDTI